MKPIAFSPARPCPRCNAAISRAEQLAQFDPVVVFACPRCGQLLWRPGLDAAGPIYPFDPNADTDSI